MLLFSLLRRFCRVDQMMDQRGKAIYTIFSMHGTENSANLSNLIDKVTRDRFLVVSSHFVTG